MKMTITATGQVTDINGVAVRVWEGVTEGGVACKVFVHRVAVHREQDSSQFERELLEQAPPAAYVPLSAVL